MSEDAPMRLEPEDLGAKNGTRFVDTACGASRSTHNGGKEYCFRPKLNFPPYKRSRHSETSEGSKDIINGGKKIKVITSGQQRRGRVVELDEDGRATTATLGLENQVNIPRPSSLLSLATSVIAGSANTVVVGKGYWMTGKWKNNADGSSECLFDV
ncbi:hypothetical protein VKT23_019685 [Stygiomarasmius scandens]|uniref:Uncharacterized protein n=1 Tax=Marasmiellus scandens TaxID=2682957 RepID=A0ABR1IKT3_9AGAR